MRHASDHLCTAVQAPRKGRADGKDQRKTAVHQPGNPLQIPKTARKKKAIAMP
jgi:hypothetical protein